MQNISLLTDSDLCLLFLFKMKTLRLIQIKHSLKYFQSDWKISELKLRLVCPARPGSLAIYIFITNLVWWWVYVINCFKVSETNNSDVRGFLWSS